MTVSLIVAVSDNNGIGIDNKLPWTHIREDMLWFIKNTKDKVVVMGSNTWASLPSKPLLNRINVVLSSTGVALGSDLAISASVEETISVLTTLYPDIEICIIGGAKVYNDFIPHVDRIYLTRVHQVVKSDTYLDVDLMMTTVGGFNRTFDDSTNSGITFQIWDKNE